jgi:hypothetical protein
MIPMNLSSITNNKRPAAEFMKKGIIFIYLVIIGQPLHGQPYIDTHVSNSFVKENVFLERAADTTKPASFNNIKSSLPRPFWPARQDVIQCYWRTWELAFGNLHQVNPGSGFISPFIDPAFNGHIFMWDEGFMLMFGRYGSRAFNFQNSLNNFYAKQHKDGFICREIRESDGTDVFERFDPSSTGPNILPWTEWEYYLNFNDTLRLKEVFPPLLAYYNWLRTYRSWPDGSYFSSGWGCGMDNQPRLPAGFNPEWSHGQMSWIDISLQEVFAGKILLQMAKRLNRNADVNDIEKEIDNLKKYINKNMWEDKTSFYYDRFKDGTLSEVKSIAAYWALLAGVVPPQNAKPFIKHLENPNEFDRLHRVPVLSADDPDYNPDGGYWRGSVWAPTNYMVLRGLTNYGEDSLAYEIAANHLNNVVKVFTQSGTLRENYAPDKVQGNNAKDFVGWTGLVPVSVLLEYVFGIRPDVPDNTIVWDIRMLDEFGVKQYPFGKNGSIDLYCKSRKNLREVPSVKVSSNVPFNLKLIWHGGSKMMAVKPAGIR